MSHLIAANERAPVIVNADDFGLDHAYNRLTLRAFQQGVISSATLMANMPAFADACELAQQHGLTGKLGLHFNLTYGQPLSQAIRTEPLFCNSHGEFELKLRRTHLRLPAAARDAVYAELEAQWQRCTEHGVRPTHIDSHQHVHNLWPLAPIIARFAASKGVPVRLARNVGGNIGLLKRLFKTALNARIARLCGVHVSYVCTPRDLLDGFRPQGSLEVVAHPTALGDDDFGDDYLPADCSLNQLLDQALSQHRYVNYSQLAKA